MSQENVSTPPLDIKKNQLAKIVGVDARFDNTCKFMVFK